MKLKTLAVAVAMAAASQAFAHGPAVVPDQTIVISGSSAQLNSLQAIADSLFVAGTIDNYSDTTGKVGANYRAYFGTANGTLGTAAGQKVLLIDRAKGGSFYGVGPLARGEAIAVMQVNAANCAAVAGATYPNPTFVCGAGAGAPPTVNLVPDLGVSDEEPALFTDLNLPATADAGVTKAGLTAVEAGNITTQTEYNVLMGIAVSNNLTLSSLSRAQVAAILAGNYTDWSQIDPTLSGAIRVNTRGAGSGTKAASNAYFLHAPCDKAVGAAVPPAPAGVNVVEQSSGGNVVAGLNADFAAGRLGVGILGLETQPLATDKFKFVSIDGVAPTKANAVSGAYDYFVGQAIQYRNTTVNGKRFVAAGNPVGDFALGFIAQATNPAIVTTVAGVALDPTVTDAGDPANAAFVSSITKGTRFGNTCAPLQLAL